MRLHHLALRTRDLERLARFYGEVLGLPILRRDARSVWLDADGTILMLELRGGVEGELDPTTLELTCFGIRPEEGGVYEQRLAACGASIEARTACTLYVRDPDGRRVGLSSFPEPLSQGRRGARRSERLP